KKTPSIIFFALFFSLVIPAVGYLYLGPLVAFLFLIGYFGGFILWMCAPAKVPFKSIKAPFWATLMAFIFLHKVEENVTNFFEVLSKNITGIAVPEITPLLIIGLLVLPVGAWLFTPLLNKRGNDFGYFLAWTFF